VERRERLRPEQPLTTPTSMHQLAPSLCSFLRFPCFDRAYRVYHLRQPSEGSDDTGYVDTRRREHTVSRSRFPLDMTSLHLQIPQTTQQSSQKTADLQTVSRSPMHCTDTSKAPSQRKSRNRESRIMCASWHSEAREQQVQSVPCPMSVYRSHHLSLTPDFDIQSTAGSTASATMHTVSVLQFHAALHACQNEKAVSFSCDRQDSSLFVPAVAPLRSVFARMRKGKTGQHELA